MFLFYANAKNRALRAESFMHEWQITEFLCQAADLSVNDLIIRENKEFRETEGEKALNPRAVNLTHKR